MRKFSKAQIITSVIIALALVIGGITYGVHKAQINVDTSSDVKVTKEVKDKKTATKKEETKGKKEEKKDSKEEKKESKKESSKSESTAKDSKKESRTSENTAKTGQDEYKTDPVPEGKPKPVEPGEIPKSSDIRVYISIDCKSLLDNMEDLEPSKKGLVPANGVILPKTAVTVPENSNVYDVLDQVTRSSGIHMEASWTPLYNSYYIRGINNLYEFDCTSGSGWMYKVDGWFPNYGVSRYIVYGGENIQFRYTCNYGDDIGGSV